MVRNIKRNAFATGMKDTRDMRPLEPRETVVESTPVDVAGVRPATVPVESSKNATSNKPQEKRIGSNVTLENWTAWKLKSIEYNTKQAVLLNAAMDYCFQQGHFDPTLIDKYR